jgi:hypothetical protein
MRTKLNVTRAGDGVFDFGNTPKGALSLWANQKPVPVDGKSVKVPFTEGEHWVFVGVNRDLIGDGNISVAIDPNLSTAKQ